MSTSEWSERVLRVLDYVHAHLDDELAPEALADVAGFSLHHFHRVFRGMVGESVMSYVRRLRLERAAFRLKHQGGEILPIAVSFGYESHEAFTRAFRAHFGVPPSVYREQEQLRLMAGISAEIREEPSRAVLTKLHVGPYEQLAGPWAELVQAVTSLALPPLGPTLGLVYDDPEITAPERCRYAPAWPVSQGWERTAPPLPPGFSVRTFPAGKYAVALHRGPYDAILADYVALLGRFLPQRGVELADEPVIERYLDAPGSVPDAELRTEICVRLR